MSIILVRGVPKPGFGRHLLLIASLSKLDGFKLFGIFKSNPSADEFAPIVLKCAALDQQPHTYNNVSTSSVIVIHIILIRSAVYSL